MASGINSGGRKRGTPVSSPMGVWSNASLSPSRAIASSSSIGPLLAPGAPLGQQVRGPRHGLHPASDHHVEFAGREPLAASAMAFRPDGQNLLRLMDGTVTGIPAATAACRAGFCPASACRRRPAAIPASRKRIEPPASVCAVGGLRPSTYWLLGGQYFIWQACAAAGTLLDQVARRLASRCVPARALAPPRQHRFRPEGRRERAAG